MDFSKEELQGAQVVFALTGHLVYSEPTDEDVKTYCDEGVFEAIPFGMDNPRIACGLADLQAWCSDSAGAEDFVERTAALRREWLALYIGAGTPEAPVWESYYTDPHGQMFSKDTLEVRKWYRRFGLQVENLRTEPDDNLGLMLKFMGSLIGLELDAAVGKEVPWSAQELQGAQKDFLVQHMLPWLPAWRYLAEKHAASSFYKGIANIVFGVCEAYALRFGVTFKEEKNAFVFSAS